MKRRFFPLIWPGLIVTMFCLPITAKANPRNQADSTFYFDIDFARFCVNDTTAQVEVYIGVPRAELRFVKSESLWVGIFECHVSIARNGTEVTNHKWQAYSAAQDSAEIKSGQVLFTQARFQLPAATYRFLVSVRDHNHPTRQGIRAFQIQIEPFPANQLSLSDLQLAAHLQRDTTQSLFYKNNHLVLPNPGGFYGLELPMLYFYAEIYNLHFPSDSGYSVHYRILDGNGNAIKTLPTKRRAIAGTKLVEVGGFNVVTLKSGSYILELRVVDHTNGSETFRRHKFFVYREKDQAEVDNITRVTPSEQLVQYYRSLSEKQLDKEFEATRYISTPEERKIYKSLKLEGKSEFLARFWEKRDDKPETPHNEYRENYLALVKYANDNFTAFREGWKTDMGRVLLVYGQPDEVERFPSSNDARAYQIWHYYEIEGGVMFVFVELKGGGEMELVHSTARNELQDSNWQRWLNPGR
ncbi:MAG: GWxTD domain-containing protein [candidate division KSB1 bacterium]|nr:GWxTD domain-containing protein [candidate division KSB1 bacterium]MDZ7302909.1 GWxTD domain-containing protein [candidate division KSB1 bacterium]MDZ7310484.1 GWxTD domain-containing protein [candidate division KSB1 bacterium]